MPAFITAQMDYIFFVYGLSFFCLSITAFFLYSNDREHRLWLWLGLFGVTHGVREWLDMFALMDSSLALDISRMAVLAVSFICLMEGARHEAARIQGRTISRMINALWLLIPVAGWLGYGLKGAEIFIRYFFGLFGGLWFAWALGQYGYREAKRRKERRYLRWLALGMLFYSLTQGVPSKGPFFPADALNTASFLAGTGIPIQLVRMFLAFTIAVVIWRYYGARRQELFSHGHILSRVRLERWLVISLSLVLVSGWLVTEDIGRATVKEEQNDLLNIAQTVAASIDLDRVSELTGTKQDVASSSYLKLREQAHTVEHAIEGIRYCYLLGRKDGQVFFYFDSDYRHYVENGSLFPASPGDSYKRSNFRLKAVFDRGQMLFEGPYQDPWGTVITAFVPVRDEKFGPVRAVLGVTVGAENWEARLLGHRMGGILGTLLLAALFMVFFIVQQRNLENEEWLRESEQKYKGLFNEMLNGFAVHEIICDSHGRPYDYRFIEVNPAFERLTGISGHQVVGKTAREVLPDIEPEWIERYGKVALQGGVDSFEQYSTALKKYFACRVFSSEPGTFAVTFEDVTGRKTAMESLAELLVRFQRQREAAIAVSRKMADGVDDMEASLRFLTEAAAKAVEVERVSVWLGNEKTWHLECADLYRVSQREHSKGMLLAREQYPTYFKALSGGDPIAAQDARRDLRTSEFSENYFKAQGIVSVLDVPIMLGGKVAGVLRFEHTAEPRKWQADEIRFASEVVSQIEQLLLMEERRKATEDLKRNYVFLQILIDTIPNPVYFKDTEARYQGCNKAFVDFLGFPKEDIIGKTVYEVTPRELAEVYDEQDRTLLASGGTLVHEGVARAVGGVFHDILFYKATWPGADGRPAGIVGIMLDITERKRIEESLRKAKEAADAADKAKDEFLANMSHEVRTPMTAILGFSELLRMTQLDDKQRNYVDSVTNSGQVLMRIINDVLDLSRIAAGKVMFENKAFDLYAVMEDVLKIGKLKAKPSVEIKMSFEPDVPRFVMSDPIRIKQVMMNLLENAIKFTPEGSILSSVRVQDVDKAGGYRLIFSVKDTGIGIPVAKQESIFRPFVQVDMTSTRQYGGIGLGLSISRSIVESMGGRIWVSSGEGKGSDFSFSLLLLSAQMLNEEEMTRSDDSLAGLRVLVVEDSSPNRELIKELLILMQCDADFATNGREALEKVGSRQYDLCLMDIQMPIMGGEEATRLIRERFGQDLPIIALTAAAMSGDRERFLAAGMTDYLSKPVEFSTLQEKILQYAKRKVS